MSSPLRIVGGRPTLASGYLAEQRRARDYAGLAAVAAVPPGRSGRRIQYWSFAGVAHDGDRRQLRGLPLTYDLTVLAPRAMGWERAKTHGHVHIASGSSGAGYAELYEVLSGAAGFLVQDLQPGPGASSVVLITASAGEVVLIPPGLHHISVNLGASRLVIADIVCRACVDEYRPLREAHGAAYFLATDDRAVPNPHYESTPPLARFTASEWSGRLRGPLYSMLCREAWRFSWLCAPGPEWTVDRSRRPALRMPREVVRSVAEDVGA